MRWLRLVGSLKVQVSFAKEPYKRDDILQKRHIILRRLLIVATPYNNHPAPLAIVFGVLGCPAKSFFLSFFLSKSQYAGKQQKFVADCDFKCLVRVRVIYTYTITVQI